MRERDGVWIAHGDGAADRAVVDAVGQGARPARQPVVRPPPPVARRTRVCRVLRRVRQRGAVAALPSRRCPAEVPARRLGGVPVRQRAVRRGDRRGAAVGRHAGVHPGLPPRAGGAAPARAAPGRAHRAVLAHSVAVSRSSADLSLAPRDARGPARERSAGVSARTRSPELRRRGRRRARRRDRRRRRANPVSMDGRQRSSPCRSASTTIAFRPRPTTHRSCWSRTGSSGPSSCTRPSSALASIGSTTRRAFRNASTRSIACSRCGPSCAAA